MIQKRHPHLQGVRHAHPVDLHQQIILQVQRQVLVKHRVQAPLPRVFPGHPANRGQRVVGRLLPLVGQQLPQFTRRVRPPPDRVPLGGGQIGPAQEFLRLEAQPAVRAPSGQQAHPPPQPPSQDCGNPPIPCRQPMGPIGFVPPEQLVSPVARQRHLDPLPRQPRDEVRGNDRRVGEGLVEVVEDGGQHIPHLGGPQSQRVVAGAKLPGHLARTIEFVVIAFGEPDREGFDGTAKVVHQGDHAARIEPAAEQHPEWDVGPQLQADRLAETVADLAGVVGECPGIGARGEQGLPVPLAPDPSRFDNDSRSPGNLFDPGEGRAGGGNVFAGEEFAQGQAIDLARAARVGQQ